MLNRIFSRPAAALDLHVAGQDLSFTGIDEFDFALSGRTAVPAAKIQRLIQCSSQELRAEARTIKDIEKHFVDILSRSIEDPTTLNDSLRELDPLIFSQDHHWREIVMAVNECGDEYNAYRRVALVKYMQYLAARQDIIKYLYSEKKRQQNRGGDSELAGERLKDTLILEAGDPSASDPTAAGANGDATYERLPKGESLTVRLAPGESVDILLSRHRCRLSNHDGLEFTDDRGRNHALSGKRTLVGRDADCAIVLDPTWRDVSRRHLLIETINQGAIRFTDMSAHGTYINPAQLHETAP